jgi:arylsulfatase A
MLISNLYCFKKGLQKSKISFFLVVLFIISFSLVSRANTKSALPNIIILLADDLGYADLGCYGSPAYTPNLDQLAEKGIKFNNCYAGHPNCSPSRASLLTGRMPNRVGMYNWRQGGSEMHLPDDEITIAELLKTKNYQTAHFGKWHLSAIPFDAELPQPQPENQGFDYYFGTEDNAKPSHHNPNNFIRNGKPLGVIEGYSCQLIADEVINWIMNKSSGKQPRFLYVAFHEPHGPIASPPELTAKYSEYKNQFTGLPQRTSKAEYYANIENLDIAVGRILQKLKELEIEDRTLVFFASDNGPVFDGAQGELRGLKGEIYDGGIKVPGILSYPKRFKGNKEINTPICFEDILPTICEITGISLPEDKKLDGKSRVALLDGDNIPGNIEMYWFFYRSSPEMSFRQGNYSLIGRCLDTTPRTHWISDIDMPFISTMRPQFFELYDLKNDPGQLHDLSAQHLQKLMELKKKMLEKLSEVQAEGPYWNQLRKYDYTIPHHIKQKEFLRSQKKYLNKIK